MKIELKAKPSEAKKLLNRTLKIAGLTLAICSTSVYAEDKPQLWSYWTSGEEAAARDALLSVAKSQNKNAELGHREITGAAPEMRQALQIALLGGKPPAVYQSSVGQELKSFADAGRLAPVDDVWKAIDGDNVFPEGIQRVVSFDGHHYAIPLNVHVFNNVFYNKRIFNRLGLTPPRTWEEFEALSATLKKQGIQPLANAGGIWTLCTAYSTILSALGKEGYYKLASGELAFNSKEMHKAIEIFTRVYANNYMKNWSGYTWSSAGDQFIKNNVAMYQAGDWVSSYFKSAGLKPGIDYDFFPAPAGIKTTIVQLDVLALTAGNSDAFTAAGKSFLKVAGSPAGQEAFNLRKGSVAANQLTPSDRYDYYSGKTFSNLNEANKDNNVVAGLQSLFPAQLGSEFAAQIATYAQNPSPQAADKMLNDLEELRKELVTQNVFVKW